MAIISLKELNRMRTSPELNKEESINLFNELLEYINNADWFTIGIMAPSSEIALLNLRDMEGKFDWHKMEVAEYPEEEGPVFLKANQLNRTIYIRVEYGLGTGILLSCQHNGEDSNADTFGPFPLGFFNAKY